MASDITSPLSIAVAKGHFNIVKHILENTTDFDLSDTGKSPLFLAAENGYYDIFYMVNDDDYDLVSDSLL
jgi:ankyrin repeat protein